MMCRKVQLGKCVAKSPRSDCMVIFARIEKLCRKDGGIGRKKGQRAVYIGK
jgi:hypothetical protein